MVAEIEGPPCPEEVEYLVHWAYRLFGRSGEGFNGVARLSYREVDAWARRTDTEIRPHEVEALMFLDGVLREGDETQQSETDA